MMQYPLGRNPTSHARCAVPGQPHAHAERLFGFGTTEPRCQGLREITL